MEVIFTAIFFVFGAVCASFIGLVTSRLSTGASIVVGRSHCDSCGITLSPYALVPILSWLITRGRCLVCRARIGSISTIAEIVLGALFAFVYVKLGLALTLPLMLVALALLAGLALYDLAHSILPPVLLYSFVGVSLFFAIASSLTFSALLFTVCVAILLSSLLAVIHLASGGRAMGLADAPLTFGLSLLVGGALALSGLIFSFWIGGVVGIILLAQRALGSTIESEVPFAPFLAVGFLLAYFTSWDAFTLVDSLLFFMDV